MPVLHNLLISGMRSPYAASQILSVYAIDQRTTSHRYQSNIRSRSALDCSLPKSVHFQGENNAEFPDTYGCSISALVSDWRQKWNSATGSNTDPLFSFGQVQVKCIGQNYSDINDTHGSTNCLIVVFNNFIIATYPKKFIVLY